MKLNIWQPIILTLVLGACAGTKGPSRAERATQVANIKTQLAIEYMRGGDYRQATVSIEEALKADSSNEDAWLVRAQIYQYLKVRDKAQESFQKALSLKPDNAEINNNYGWFLCSEMNNPAQSISYFDKALADILLRLSPTSTRAFAARRWDNIRWQKLISNALWLRNLNSRLRLKNWQEPKCWQAI